MLHPYFIHRKPLINPEGQLNAEINHLSVTFTVHLTTAVMMIISDRSLCLTSGCSTGLNRGNTNMFYQHTVPQNSPKYSSASTNCFTALSSQIIVQLNSKLANFCISDYNAAQQPNYLHLHLCI